jgi:signal transduction histidine kinase
MNLLRRYLTSSNVLSGPVILLISLFTVTANLGDTSLNGTQFVTERVALVLGGQALFFFGIWVCDRLFIRHISSASRWMVLLGVIVGFATLRGILYAAAARLLGLTTELNLLPRILSTMSTLVLLLLIVVVIFGLVVESANQRRELKSIRRRIAELKTRRTHQRERNAALLKQTVSQLEQSLSPELLDTPERMLSAFRSSIDEVIRPIALALNRQADLLDRGVTVPAKPANWQKFLRKMMDTRSLNPLAGVTLFALWVMLPMTRVLPVSEALGLVALLAVTMWVLTSGIQFIAARCLAGKRNFLAPVVLALSSLLGVALAGIFMPAWMTGRFELGLFASSMISGFLAAGVRLAFRESRKVSQVIAQANTDLDWMLARTNEVQLFNDRVITTTLHGKAQAALAAAALRLQQAVRDGSNVEHAAKLAREEAARVLVVVTNIEQVIEPLTEALKELAQLWHGVCEIAWDENDEVFTQIDDDPVCARLCAELIVELCTNAIKHGNAKRLLLSVTRVNERAMSVAVSNDGEGLTNERSGFGSRLLEQSCLSWKAFDADGVTQVTVTVPFSVVQSD